MKQSLESDSNVIEKRFDEVFDLSLGRTPSRGVDAYWGGTHTWVSIADMSCGKHISETKERITDKALVETNIPIVKKGTVIMSFKLSIGKVCIADTDLYTNEAIMAFVPKPQYNILPEFLYYYLMFYKWNNSNEVVLGFTLNKKTISQSIVTIPTLTEQKRIVKILDRELEKIDALKENAEKNLQHAKDLFQSALKQELQPKEGWEISKLSEVVRVINGRAYSKEELLTSGKYRVLRVGNFFTNDSWYYSDLELEEDKYCEDGDLLYAWSASFGPKIWNGEKVIYHYHIWKMVPNCTMDKLFLFYWLQSPHLTNQVMSNLHGTTMVHITKGTMEASSICYPSIQKQAQIVTRLDKLNERCKTLEENYTKTIALCDDMKQALLRKAFNGEL